MKKKMIATIAILLTLGIFIGKVVQKIVASPEADQEFIDKYFIK